MTIELIIRLIADGTVVVIALLATTALLVGVPNKRKFEVYSRILMAGLTAYLAAKLIGAVYQPATERPFELLGLQPDAAYINNPGFPSDHVLFATVLSLAVWFETNYNKLAYLLFGLTVVMSIGRVLALVHTPLDVIGGMIIALIGSVWYIQPKHLKSYRNRRKNIRSQKVQH